MRRAWPRYKRVTPRWRVLRQRRRECAEHAEPPAHQLRLLVAEAAVTPSLKNTLLSVVAGGLVLGAIGAAVVGVSTFDKIGRK